MYKPDGVASNSVSATAREFVTRTTTDAVAFFCVLAPGAIAGGAVWAKTAPAVNAALTPDATKANDFR